MHNEQGIHETSKVTEMLTIAITRPPGLNKIFAPVVVV